MEAITISKRKKKLSQQEEVPEIDLDEQDLLALYKDLEEDTEEALGYKRRSKVPTKKEREEQELEEEPIGEALREEEYEEPGGRGKKYSRFPLTEALAIYQERALSTDPAIENNWKISDLRSGITDRDSEIYQLMEEDSRRIKNDLRPKYTDLILGGVASSVSWALTNKYSSLVDQVNKMTGKTVEDLFQEGMWQIASMYQNGDFNPTAKFYITEGGEKRPSANFRNYATSVLQKYLFSERNDAIAATTAKLGKDTYLLWDCANCGSTNVISQPQSTYTCQYCNTENTDVKLVKPSTAIENLEQTAVGGGEDEDLMLADLIGDPTSAVPIEGIDVASTLEEIRNYAKDLPAVEDNPALLDTFDYMFQVVTETGDLPDDVTIMSFLNERFKELAEDQDAQSIADEFSFEDIEEEEEISEPEPKPQPPKPTESEEDYIVGSYKLCLNVEEHDDEKPRVLPVEDTYCDECGNRDLEYIEGAEAIGEQEGVEEVFEDIAPPISAITVDVPDKAYQCCFNSELHDPELPIILSTEEKYCPQCNERNLESLSEQEAQDLVEEGVLVDDAELKQQVRQQIEQIQPKKTQKQAPLPKGEGKLIYVCTNKERHIGNRDMVLEKPWCPYCKTDAHISLSRAEKRPVSWKDFESFKEQMSKDDDIMALWAEVKERLKDSVMS